MHADTNLLTDFPELLAAAVSSSGADLAGLVTPEELRVGVLAPASCRAKLRADPLAADDELRQLNPLLLYTGEQPEQVKALGREFVTAYGETVRQRHGTWLWYSLDL